MDIKASIEALDEVDKSFKCEEVPHKYLKVTREVISIQSIKLKVVTDRNQRSSLDNVAKCAAYLYSKIEEETNNNRKALYYILLGSSIRRMKEEKVEKLVRLYCKGSICGLTMCSQRSTIKDLNSVLEWIDSQNEELKLKVPVD